MLPKVLVIPDDTSKSECPKCKKNKKSPGYVLCPACIVDLQRESEVARVIREMLTGYEKISRGYETDI
jgi:hypothetical protein